jgi:ferredoxin
MGCPFVLVRDMGRRLRRPTISWPRRVRTKWIAVGLFAGVLFAYELFDLWALPRATAYLVLAYFAAALAVDLVFSGASFCKYVCPIGQFNFIASTVSPLELQVRDQATCRTCRTVDCIKGRRRPDAPRQITQRGCELALFLPLKVGNMDCTLCLDCVQACPHDNIALSPRIPGAELADFRRRSGVGRFERRWDIGALAVLFAFGGLLNAFAMTAPASNAERWLSAATGVTSEALALASLFVVGLGVAPMILLGGAAAATRLIGRDTASAAQIALRYAYAFVPFGCGVWLAHYGFHLLTGFLTIVPVAQSAAADLLGRTALGEPRWNWGGLRPGSVLPIELGFILLGTIGSIALAHRISQRRSLVRAGVSTAPWAFVLVGLAAAAIWIVFQPMDLRGVGLPG